MQDAGELFLWWCSTIVSRTCGSAQTIRKTHYRTYGGVRNTHLWIESRIPVRAYQGKLLHQ